MPRKDIEIERKQTSHDVARIKAVRHATKNFVRLFKSSNSESKLDLHYDGQDMECLEKSAEYFLQNCQTELLKNIEKLRKLEPNDRKYHDTLKNIDRITQSMDAIAKIYSVETYNRLQ